MDIGCGRGVLGLTCDDEISSGMKVDGAYTVAMLHLVQHCTIVSINDPENLVLATYWCHTTYCAYMHVFSPLACMQHECIMHATQALHTPMH